MMKSKLIGFATVAGVTVALSAPAVAQTTGTTEQQRNRTTAERAGDDERGAGQRMSDAWIHTKVKTQFVGEDALENSDIDVDVKNGVVTLKGTVVSAAGRERAKEIARETEGVVRVDDRLTIGMAQDRNDRDRDNRTTVGTTGVGRDARDEAREAREEAREARDEARQTARDARDDARETRDEARQTTREARDDAREAREEAREARDDARETGREAREEAREAGRETEGAVGTAGTAVHDGWITTKVKTSFAGEDALENSDIDVDTKNGVVTLKGTVASAAAKNRAEAAAKEVEGVTRVKNQLKIRAANQRTDNR
jgi:hyperosmotically inducible periplasmic protein